MPRSLAERKMVVGMWWFSCNKDAANPHIRCIPVCQEVKTYQSEEFFMATTPFEAPRLILRLEADDSDLEVSLVGISRAILNAKISLEVYVEPPREAGLGREHVGLLDTCMCGTQDATQGVEGAYQQALERIGSKRDQSSPCAFLHEKLQGLVVVHGE